MNKNISMKVLFEPNPIQWGLRGDPFLWEAMKNKFALTPIPNDVEHLAELIQQQFKEITLHSLNEVNHFKINEFNHGGMSGGFIAPEFWCNTIIPLLQKRLLDYHEQY